MTSVHYLKSCWKAALLYGKYAQRKKSFLSPPLPPPTPCHAALGLEALGLGFWELKAGGRLAFPSGFPWSRARHLYSSLRTSHSWMGSCCPSFCSPRGWACSVWRGTPGPTPQPFGKSPMPPDSCGKGPFPGTSASAEWQLCLGGSQEPPRVTWLQVFRQDTGWP